MSITKSKSVVGTTLTTTAEEPTTTAKRRKVAKSFPLTAHKGTNRWCKKIKGKLYYFGPWNNGDAKAAQAALEKYLEQKDDLLAGRAPRLKTDALTIMDLCNRFLTTKRHLVDTGELSARSWADYYKSCELVIKAFGKNRAIADLVVDDFERLRKVIAKGSNGHPLNPVSLGNEIQRVRVLFKYAYDSMLVDRPVRYGQTFKRPSKSVLRKARNGKAPRMFEAVELRRLIAAAGVPLRAMIYLGINGGMGNRDVATLPLTAVDLKKGWLNYPRPKTGIARRFPLWPETIKALEAALAERPTPHDDAALDKVFVTKYGAAWAKSPKLSDDGSVADAYVDDPVAKEFAKLLGKLGLKRKGLGFYAIRHTFETVAGGSKDQVAVDHVMGHADNSMAAEYRERIDDERLVDVVNHVRNWLATNGRGEEEKMPDGGWTIEPAPSQNDEATIQ